MFEEVENVYRIMVSLMLMPLMLFIILVWFIFSYQKRKFLYENEKKDAILREQSLKLQNQEAIEHERNRIASEMHDELGSGLTIIQYLSDAIISKTDDPVILEDVTKIAGYCGVLVRNMSEIIWAMNSRFDNLDGLIGYLRRYIVEYLEDNKMDHSFVADNFDPKTIISGEKRRNLYLVVKELLHNSIKYANASKIIIEIEAHSEIVIKIIEKNGIGFDPQIKKGDGNGLFNIENRMLRIGGQIMYSKDNGDMAMSICLPLNTDNFQIKPKQ
jgi:signal transduction histidine kinase